MPQFRLTVSNMQYYLHGQKFLHIIEITAPAAVRISFHASSGLESSQSNICKS